MSEREIPRAAAIGIAVDSLEQVARRLVEIAEIDGPPSLVRGEAAIITKRIEQIRVALVSKDGGAGH
jgi:hypothetical protein